MPEGHAIGYSDYDNRALKYTARITVSGDLNCDGVVDEYDIEAFVLALVNENAYCAAYPDCNHILADINGDGAVDVFDIDPFVALLVP